MDEIPRTGWYRFWEIMPGALSWLTLIIPFVAAYWFPRAVAIFLIIYLSFWFLRTIKSSIFFLYAYRKSRRFEKLDWQRLLDFFSDSEARPHNELEEETVKHIQYLRQRGCYKAWTDIRHIIIIPTFKEEKEVLDSTLESLTHVAFPLEKIIFVLATEERDKKRALENAAYIEKKFAGFFGAFFHIMHPANLPNEVPAKGANISYAARFVTDVLEKGGTDINNYLVTTLDADNRPHPTYFSNLTYHFLMEKNRSRASYQPLAFFSNNIWEVPFTNRLIGLANTFWYFSESGEGHRLYNASAYAQSLDALKTMDFWSRQSIVEDLHQYWRAFFTFRGNHKIVPLFVAVYQDALQNKTYFTSLVGQYKQLRRWAWGVAEIPYIIMKTWRLRHEIPVLKAFKQLMYLWYMLFLWATGPLIIFFNKSIPTFLNPQFGESLFIYNLGGLWGIIFNIIMLSIAICFGIMIFSMPLPDGKFSKLHFLSFVFQIVLTPFIILIYGAVPALDAQTRLMFNKPLAFSVTEKIRKIN